MAPWLPRRLFGAISGRLRRVADRFAPGRERNAASASDESIALAEAEAAALRRDWTASADAYARVRDLAPDNPTGHLLGGWTLWEAGRFDEADAVLSGALAKFPNNEWIALCYGMSAYVKGDLAVAAERYAHARDAFPKNPRGYIEGARALFEAGRQLQAEPILQAAIRKFPNERAVWISFGRNASQCGYWDEAVRRWEACAKRFQGEKFWERKLTLAVYERDFAKAGVAGSAKAAGVVLDESSARDLMMQFESIGNNCEFGLLQRELGAEPLGLLRFGDMPTFAFLMQSLCSEFEGVGEPENTRGDFGIFGEHVIQSTRGFGWMHTYVYEGGSQTLDETVKQMLPRLKYLRRRLLETLEGGLKILVYKQWPDITDAQIGLLEAALATYGPNRLVCVRQPTDTHGVGEVYRFSERCVIGHVAFPEFIPPSQPPDVRAWLSVCGKAKELLGEAGGEIEAMDPATRIAKRQALLSALQSGDTAGA